MAVLPLNAWNVSEDQFRSNLEKYEAGPPVVIHGKVQKGSYGGLYKTSDEACFIKYSSPASAADTEEDVLWQSYCAQKELDILEFAKIHHMRHVIRQIDAFCMTEQRYASVQLNGGLSLKNIYLCSPKHLQKMPSLKKIQKIGIQLFEALSDLHKHNILHGDIKPSNIVLNESEKLNVIDFSISEQLNRDFSPLVKFSSHYRPPETFRLRKTFLKSDVWAASCTLLELIYKKHIFPGATDDEIYSSIIARFGCKPQVYSEFVATRSLKELIDSLQTYEMDPELFNLFKDLILRTLEPNVEKRMTAEETLKHPFFKSCVHTCSQKNEETTTPENNIAATTKIWTDVPFFRLSL
ncbi:MAG: hypothetical protein COT85_00645 [Chlamydiae bacterium CG10_big_fil_rev_8_21_14_0_10_42_34]|nr:MAG: hypothetical protein COT85_00645 [Chlamydiae bacterium CG10_big_fil_rev_8_21_14_0_10_42_34]